MNRFVFGSLGVFRMPSGPVVAVGVDSVFGVGITAG